MGAPDGPFTFKNNEDMKLSELLHALIRDQDMQVTELSKRANVNRSYIYRKLEGQDTNMESLFDILTGDVEPDEFVMVLNLIKRIKINQQIL